MDRLSNFTVLIKPKAVKISALEEKPSDLSNVVTGNFFLRSIITKIQSLISVVKSIHDPLNGITRA